MEKLYRILPTEEASKLNFDLLYETGINQARHSLDQSQIIVQYIQQPTQVDTTFLNLAEAKHLMSTPEWYDYDSEI